jgi:hypothetical protein
MFPWSTLTQPSKKLQYCTPLWRGHGGRRQVWLFFPRGYGNAVRGLRSVGIPPKPKWWHTICIQVWWEVERDKILAFFSFLHFLFFRNIDFYFHFLIHFLFKKVFGIWKITDAIQVLRSFLSGNCQVWLDASSWLERKQFYSYRFGHFFASTSSNTQYMFQHPIIMMSKAISDGNSAWELEVGFPREPAHLFQTL